MALCLECLRCPPALLSYSRSRDDMHYSSLTHLGSLRTGQRWQLFQQKLKLLDILRWCLQIVKTAQTRLGIYSTPLPPNLCTFCPTCDDHALSASCTVIFIP